MASLLADVSNLVEYEYLAIAGLPGEIIELMKEPAKRSELVKELLKGMSVTDIDKVLSYHEAVPPGGMSAKRSESEKERLKGMPVTGMRARYTSFLSPKWGYLTRARQ